ncbi:tail fiber assembly protein [Pseudomonas lundensis]|uniref:tail fiber assembly protein n=1 Tax=Pseudomonas lundensis TaxID=86185 RepID=UPI00089DB230|nr:tail fiber assembly protein [Pseudomonas lundensis]
MDDVIDVVEGGEVLEPVEVVGWWDMPEVVPPVLCAVHRGTGEFLGTSLADPSPLEPGVWAFPAYSYEIEAPPLKPGFVALINRNEDGWVLVADHRGATVYTTDTGEPRQWQALGDLPEGYTLQAPETEFDTWEGDKWVVDEPARAEVLRSVAYRKQALANQFATGRINTLQDAVDLEMATEDEAAALRGWKVYRVELSRLDISAAAPAAEDWPTSPNDTALVTWIDSQMSA